MKKTVIIAAAGKGDRLGLGLPKCLVNLNGHAIFEYQLKAFKNFDEIRMIVGYKSEDVIAAVSAVNKNVVFIHNHDFGNTTTLQSMYLGAKGFSGKALFIDGDMVFSQKTANEIAIGCDEGHEFIGVASDISEQPVYTGVENGNILWFSYDKESRYEWANVAHIDCTKLEYNKTHFYIQLEKFLPLKALLIERWEVDTPNDFALAEKAIRDNPDKFDFRR